MPVSFNAKVDRRFLNRFRRRFEQFELQAGVLEPTKPHFKAKPIYKKNGKRKTKNAAFTSVDGLKARRKSRIQAGTVGMIADVQGKRVDFIRAPFKQATSPALKALRKAWIRFFSARNPSTMRRVVEQALVNVIRDPIRRRRYGPNSALTTRIKGFNRRLFDTGQLWKSIKAKVTRSPRKTKNV
jgi:hypothetical protein